MLECAAGARGAVGPGAGRAAGAGSGPGRRTAAGLARDGGVAPRLPRSCRGSCGPGTSWWSIRRRRCPPPSTGGSGGARGRRALLDAGDDGRWAVELRGPDGRGSTRAARGRAGGGGRTAARGCAAGAGGAAGAPGADRLWWARVSGGGAGAAAAVRAADPLLATRSGTSRCPRIRRCSRCPPPTGRASAEMPSAARPFTARLVAELVSRGVQFAPITLHTGVASAEAHEPPYPERFAVPATTARLVNAARAGRRAGRGGRYDGGTGPGVGGRGRTGWCGRPRAGPIWW